MVNISSHNLRYDRVDSAYLDCLNDNLAVLLDHLGVADLRTPFACQWFFDFEPQRQPHSLLLERVAVEDLIREQAGCTITRHRLDNQSAVAICEDYLQQGQPVLLFGDAYLMPWLPYFGREHMEHSFIIDGISADRQLLHIVDAYENRTEWGRAAPTATCLPTQALQRLTEGLEWPNAGMLLVLRKTLPTCPPDTIELLQCNAAQISAQQVQQPVARFSQYYRAAAQDPAVAKEFALACWLVARARAYHQLWLADRAREQPELLDQRFVELFSEAVVEPWQRVSEFAYILLRRVSRGRAAPDSCFEMLEQTVQPNEIRVAQELAQHMSRKHLAAIEVSRC